LRKIDDFVLIFALTYSFSLQVADDCQKVIFVGRPGLVKCRFGDYSGPEGSWFDQKRLGTSGDSSKAL
jgi:hypothetical protein